MNSGSFTTLSKASRSAANRSAGTAGGVISARPIAEPGNELDDLLGLRILDQLLHQGHVRKIGGPLEPSLNHRDQTAIVEGALLRGAPYVPGAREHVDLAAVYRQDHLGRARITAHQV